MCIHPILDTRLSDPDMLYYLNSRVQHWDQKKSRWAYAKIKQSLCKKSLRICVTRVDVTYLNIYYLIKQTKLAAVYYVISNATFEYFPWNEPSFFLVFNARRICGIKDSLE